MSIFLTCWPTSHMWSLKIWGLQTSGNGPLVGDLGAPSYFLLHISVFSSGLSPFLCDTHKLTGPLSTSGRTRFGLMEVTFIILPDLHSSLS